MQPYVYAYTYINIYIYINQIDLFRLYIYRYIICFCMYRLSHVTGLETILIKLNEKCDSYIDHHRTSERASTLDSLLFL